VDSYKTYLILALAGMAGAVIRSLLVHDGSILLWNTWEKDGKKGIDLGIIGAMMLGATVGVIVDTSPLVAFIAAISGSLLLEEMVRKTKGPNPPTGD
jgi:hypothetical protein